MSAQEYDRWYIVPAEEQTDENGNIIEIAPKYGNNDGINGYAGNTVEPSVIDTHYAGLIQQYPDIDEWYIVRLYGTWAALNDISVLGDTRNLATNYQDVAAVLDQRFPDIDRDPEAWAEGFYVGTPGTGGGGE